MAILMDEAVFHDGRVHVMERMCETCVFRPGNRMHLQPGRVAGMVRDAVSVEGHITCHDTLYGQTDQEAVCRGFFDQHRTQLLQVAERLDIIEYVGPSAHPVSPPRSTVRAGKAREGGSRVEG